MSIYGTIADLRETPYGSISHFLLLIEQAEPLGWDGGPQSEVIKLVVIFASTLNKTQASLVSQGLKNLPAMQETQEMWV